MASHSLVSSIEPAMTNHPKDRHVLAAAVGVGAQVVVSRNVDDFPPAACEPLGVEAVSPDDFLIDLFHLDSPAALRAVSDQAAALTRPSLNVQQVLDYLAIDAPKFAELIRQTS
jgi:hypothetical protein